LVLFRSVRAAAVGCLLGWVAGLATALSDFGAHWLWLEGMRDRAALLVRLVGLQLPAGAWLGALIGAAVGLTDALIDRAAARTTLSAVAVDRARAARTTALLAPAVVWVGLSLFGGGMMSRLPAKNALEAIVCGALLGGTLSLAYLAQCGDAATRQRPRARRWLAAGAFGVALGLGKLNQWLLPKLYDNVHGALSAAAFVAFMAAGFLLLVPRLRPRTTRALMYALAPSLVLAAWLLSLTLAALDDNQNVRVALLHPNAAHSRSLMQAIAPIWIEPAQRRAMEQAKQKARLARTLRKRVRGAGPVLEDAHVLLITVDALRPDHLGAYGYKRPTSPELDKLAAQSVLFERVYAPAPHSSYSLCSLMTSEYLHETLDLGHPAPTDTLASVLAQAGYHTAGFYSEGIFHTAADRLERYEHDAFGFALHDQVTYTAEELTDRVLQEVDRTVARGEPNSFFWVHYFDVHEPYRSTHFGSSDMDRYDSEILHVDGQVARLVREVRKRLSRDVIVVVSADHGEEFYDHGGVYHGSTLYEEQVRVPLLVNFTGLAPRRIATPIKTLDIAPTLLALVGLDAPSTMRGDDLRPIALGHNDAPSPVYSAVIHKKMVVKWPYKLIADLRFGLFELYDLEHDPRERENLADQRPELLAALRAEVYAWLDSLAPNATSVQAPNEIALDRGRLGDRRAVEALAKLVADAHAAPEQRIEAAHILGHLADERATSRLLVAQEDKRNPRVAAEAAIALGRMFDARARAALRRLVQSEDADLRVRAAVSLGRLRDAHAVPALIDALWIAQNDYERQEAVRWLGRLRDARAIDPLIRLLPEMRTRYLVPIALGMIGDGRAYAPLTEVLTWDNHANVRDATVQGLGLLGDARAIELIVPLAAIDESLKAATESLVRLGALRSGAIGGTDLVAGDANAHDFGDCVAGPLRHDWDYQHRTYCSMKHDSATLSLAVPPAVAEAPYGALAIISVKRVDASHAAELELSIEGHAFDAIKVDGSWDEYRFVLPAGSVRAGRAQARLHATDPAARFGVDHVLLLPRSSELLAQRVD
jgi:arylsulfatase A-like enzyme